MKRIGELLLRAGNLLRRLSGLRVVCSLAVLVALSACSLTTQSDGLQDKLRVESVSVVLETSGSYPFYYNLPEEESVRFSTGDTGLTKNKIASDFSTALRRELIPASRNGQRPVDVKIQILRLSLLTGSNNWTELVSILFVQDRETGEMLVDKEEVYVCDCYEKTQNIVQAYDFLLKGTPAEVKRRLLK